jgi:hypothetical protein
MTSLSRIEWAYWVVVAVLGLSSLGLATYRASGLPDLGVTLGPDLTVRSVDEPAPSGADPTFKPGDRLTALEGQAVTDLRDLRVIMKSLPPQALTSDKGLRYQLVRPRHRFSISVGGDELDPTSLPSGYNPETDRLVKLNGRPMEVGLEGVRGILGTEDEALLTFERKNAVFSGRVQVDERDTGGDVGIVFGVALIAMLMLWRLRSPELPEVSAAAVALETLGFGWVALLTVWYQWLLSDFILAAGVITALVMARPLAMFARAQAFPRVSGGKGLWSLLIGALSAAAIVAMLFQGALEHAEDALYAGAFVAGLFLAYEIILVAFDDRPHMTLREGGGYLIGILIVAIATAVLSWNVVPILFEEQLWRWFATAFFAFVWFGDVLFLRRGPSRAGYSELVDAGDRRDALIRYLGDVADEMPHTRPLLVLQQGGLSVVVRWNAGELEFGSAPDEVRDLVSILLQERTRIPLPSHEDRGSHPLSGIAQTMDIVLALRLNTPEGALEFPNTDLVLLAIEESNAAELPSYASAETIDFAQRELGVGAWTAAYIELMERFDSLGHSPGAATPRPTTTQDDAETPAAGASDSDAGASGDGEQIDRETLQEEVARAEEAEQRLDTLRGQLEEADETIEMLREDRSSLAEQVQALRDRWRQVVEPSRHAETLLEPELVEGLSYLLESPGPIAVGGSIGAGKSFAVRYAMHLDDQSPEALAVYNAFLDSADDHHRRLFGESEASDPVDFNGFVETARGGALLVRSADRLSDSVILGLCNASEELDFRLFLAFQAENVEDQSVVGDRSSGVRDRLEDRELIVPPLRRRQTLLPRLLDYYRDRYARLRDLDVEGFTDKAMASLLAHPYPAEIREAKLLVDLSVLRCESGQIEMRDLPEMVAPAEVPADGVPQPNWSEGEDGSSKP